MGRSRVDLALAEAPNLCLSAGGGGWPVEHSPVAALWWVSRWELGRFRNAYICVYAKNI